MRCKDAGPKRCRLARSQVFPMQGRFPRPYDPRATRCGMRALHGARPAQPVEIESKLVGSHSSWPCWPLLQYVPKLSRLRQDRAGPIYVGHLDVASCHLLLFDKDPAVRDRGLNLVQSGLSLTP